MLTFPDIDPVIFAIGPLKVRWYGMMYVLGFAATYLLVRRQIAVFKLTGLAKEFENLNLAMLISLVLGGRLGYVLFYNFSYYISHPLEMLATWQGGMSFHGGLIGVVAGGWLYCRWKKMNFLENADVYVVTVPVGLGLGRLGNFINGELFGRASDVPWAMVFPGGGPVARHPSQLYEALLEGLLLFLILWPLRKKQVRNAWPHGTMLALFLVLYGVFRSFVEFFREPDAHIGLVGGLISRGQVLSIIMICAGALLFAAVSRKKGS